MLDQRRLREGPRRRSPRLPAVIMEVVRYVGGWVVLIEQSSFEVGLERWCFAGESDGQCSRARRYWNSDQRSVRHGRDPGSSCNGSGRALSCHVALLLQRQPVAAVTLTVSVAVSPVDALRRQARSPVGGRRAGELAAVGGGKRGRIGLDGAARPAVGQVQYLRTYSRYRARTSPPRTSFRLGAGIGYRVGAEQQNRDAAFVLLAAQRALACKASTRVRAAGPRWRAGVRCRRDGAACGRPSRDR
jgi:hypothetical protein